MKGSILVIDDEEIIREALEALLVVEGYQVATAATAEQGLDSLSARQICTLTPYFFSNAWPSGPDSVVAIEVYSVSVPSSRAFAAKRSSRSAPL